MSEEKLWSVDLDLNSYRNILFRCAEGDIHQMVSEFIDSELSISTRSSQSGGSNYSYEEGDPNNTVMEIIQASAYRLEQRHTQDGSEVEANA